MGMIPDLPVAMLPVPEAAVVFRRTAATSR